jgi:hypothetical protein
MEHRRRATDRSRIAPALAIVLVLAVAGCHPAPPRTLPASPWEPQAPTVALVAHAALPTGMKFQDLEVGGLSGLSYDRDADLFSAVVDDPSGHPPARLLRFRWHPPAEPVLVEWLVLTDHGSALPPGGADLEGLARRGNGEMFVSSEGDVKKGIAPWIARFGADGALRARLPLPRAFVVRDGHGAAHNLGPEALALEPGEGALLAGLENPLQQDQPPPAGEPGRCRILRWALGGAGAPREWLYPVDPPHAPPPEPGKIRVAGLVDLLPWRGHLLTLERSWVEGVGFSVRLFEATLEGAEEVTGVDSLGSRPRRTAGKRLLADFGVLGVPLDNYEGMAFGPPAADGSPLLYVIADNNFNVLEQTHLVALSLGPRATPAPAVSTPSHRAAIGAAEWLLRQGRDAHPGTLWPADPGKAPPTPDPESLYSGTPGVVLFFLEAWKQTGDARYLAAARAGADHLVEVVETTEEPGLYGGLAGIGYVLAEAGRRTGEPRYTAAARRSVALLRERAVRRGAGVEWGAAPANDVVFGSSGIGLFLLWAAKALDEPPARETAVLAGRRLLELGLPAPPGEEGRKWLLAPGVERVYPNFSHGTAGVAYFLATLHAETGERDFLDGAVAGARYLETIATPGPGDSCLIFRHEPDATDLYYLSWCHGPAGTARLFYRLYLATGDPQWMHWVERLARGVLESGIPERSPPGFWNVGQCCGSAGVAEFFLALHRATGKHEYLDFARRMTSQLLAKATADGDGSRWIQAENRTSPDDVAAQTGLMQGASGIGLWLLRLDAYERGDRTAGFTLPDSPF